MTILRTKGTQSLPLTEEEVIGVARALPEWRHDPIGNALIRQAGAGSTLWFSSGELWTTNPTHETIASMLDIARHLDARVRGDELETYRTADESYVHPDDVEAKQRAERAIDWKRYASYAPPAIGVVLILYAGLRWLFRYANP